jgi:hypothetical protein
MQVGLLIGSIGDGTRDSIVAMIPTPSFEVQSCWMTTMMHLQP